MAEPPRWLFALELPASARLLACLMWSHAYQADASPFVRVSQATLAAEMGMTDRNVRKLFDLLEAAGVVQETRQGDRWGWRLLDENRNARSAFEHEKPERPFRFSPETGTPVPDPNRNARSAFRQNRNARTKKPERPFHRARSEQLTSSSSTEERLRRINGRAREISPEARQVLEHLRPLTPPGCPVLQATVLDAEFLEELLVDGAEPAGLCELFAQVAEVVRQDERQAKWWGPEMFARARFRTWVQIVRQRTHAPRGAGPSVESSEEGRAPSDYLRRLLGSEDP